MTVQRAGSKPAASTSQRLLVAEATVVGALILALFVRELPSLRRELRIWRMAGGLRAGHRYP
ncbi:hypothetical protein [Streptomyces sp. NPDC048419]|uniref:hypothetical protein n=1 Tax=Streptomyces sp. NPDC048419 TaxID=3365547 RepID=UPI0037128C9D